MLERLSLCPVNNSNVCDSVAQESGYSQSFPFHDQIKNRMCHYTIILLWASIPE